MKIVVFGATGTIGRPFIEEALKDGHEITAFARNPKKLNLDHPNLKLFVGNAYDAEDVARAVKGQEAVVVTLGSGMSRKSKVRSAGTLNVIRAMHQHDVKRLICQSTLGTHESWNNLNFYWKRIMFGALLLPVFRDHELQEKLVQASGLDWTIVRPSSFSDEDANGSYRENFDAQERGLSLKIARRDVAAFLKRQLVETVYSQQAVGISN